MHAQSWKNWSEESKFSLSRWQMWAARIVLKNVDYGNASWVELIKYQRC